MASFKGVTILLLSFSAIALAAYDDSDSHALNQDIPYPLHGDYQVPSQVTRNARHAPFLAGAATGAIIANHRHPTYYAPTYYYPSTYPSSGYYSNGYYYSG